MKTQAFFGLCFAALAFVNTCSAVEYFVAPGGNDFNTGTQKAPWRTIQHAADLAQPGDTITVRAGVYCERVNPPRGGVSDRKRIVYQGAPGERVEIKGSEIVKGWERVGQDVWKVILPNSFFGSFNPYSHRIHGDWFDPKGREHHTGAVYLNGDWFVEAAKLEEVLQPDAHPQWLKGWNLPYHPQLWFAQVDPTNTTIWAQFKGISPNQQLVTTALLGKATIPQVGYEDPTGLPLKIDRDYFDKARNRKHPTPGPFEKPGLGTLSLKLR